MCFDEFTELETEKKIAKEVVKQALKDYPKKPMRTGRTPVRTPKKEKNGVIGRRDSLDKEIAQDISTPPPTAPVTPHASPSRALTTPRSSVESFIPPSALPAHQPLVPPRPPQHHDATPDRRRKEAILKVKGTPTHHPMSRWSLDKIQGRESPR